MQSTLSLLTTLLLGLGAEPNLQAETCVAQDELLRFSANSSTGLEPWIGRVAFLRIQKASSICVPMPMTPHNRG